jgi:VIT1/CCC1 family predicted Fe2+/Mn2+ transporter
MENDEIKRYLENWSDETNSATLYRALADTAKDERMAEVYRRLAEVEVKHADKWVDLLKQNGLSAPAFRPSWRTRILLWLGKHFGAEMILPSIQAMEQKGGDSYNMQPEAAEMVKDERSHARLVNQITRTMRGGFEGGALAQLEGRHRATGGNALRAAVLGANDGLVSNLSLVMGVAGATMDNRSILIAGLAGLLAGAFSMALGEWLSVQSSRELYSHQIKIETMEISQAPDEETDELALIYEARGLEKDIAKNLATQIMAKPESAVDTLAREELGINPDELGGSAWEAAITSFVLFAIGAIIPVSAFMLFNGIHAVIISILLSVAGLFLIGAITSLFTGRSVLFSGSRMVIFGLLAAAITFGIGKLIGVSVGG